MALAVAAAALALLWYHRLSVAWYLAHLKDVGDGASRLLGGAHVSMPKPPTASGASEAEVVSAAGDTGGGEDDGDEAAEEEETGDQSPVDAVTEEDAEGFGDGAPGEELDEDGSRKGRPMYRAAVAVSRVTRGAAAATLAVPAGLGGGMVGGTLGVTGGPSGMLNGAILGATAGGAMMFYAFGLLRTPKRKHA
eukprot:SM002983S11256  [mRNA]  locus=s2983:655:1534:- [translate_table: standard]